ncbi:AMDB-like protein [Mya arenaria]|uniref:AMDB-like protein n=1 Tax=Mya arenaria TaxID=6604 RepID=A0ABY7DTE3_MYAAR|nr:AMDB-like protein [Mya arenaria]
MWNLFVQVIIAGVVIKVRGDRNCSIDHNGFPNDACTFDLRMRGAQPAQSDQYYCTGYRVTEDILGHPANSTAEGYIVKYEALADANTAHHILVFGCKSLRKDINSFWQCGYVCEGDQIIFAWAKNAPPLTLPKGPDTSGIRLFITEQRQKFISGIYLLLSYGVTIPEQTEKFHIDSSCRFNWRDSIVPFGFRTHAHSLGRVISGYRVNSGEYDLIGKGNPQWPQAFYPVKGDIAINPGDILAARCTYNSTGRGRATYIGSTSEDEMCNFYIMYYMNATLESQRGVDTCEGNTVSWVFDNIPTDSDTPLPFNPALEDVAMGHHHHHAMTGGGDKEEGKPAGGLDKISPPGNTIVAQPGGKTKDIGNNLLKSSNNGDGLNKNGFKLPSKGSVAGFDNDFGDRFDVGKDRFGLSSVNERDYNVGNRRPYFLDYPSYEDYDYDAMRQRGRNRLKNPQYDWYGAVDNLGFSDFPKGSLPKLSRNRNKNFNNKYDEYATREALDRKSGTFGSLAGSKPHLSTGRKPGPVAFQSVVGGSVMSGVALDPTLGLEFVSGVETVTVGQVGGLAIGKEGELFYLPHGLTVDSRGNIWVTDVALHQVFRIPAGQEPGKEKVDMTLGVQFEPGSDKEHFCKPTDVAVLQSGEFFVADGYCNSRIMKFDENGYFMQQFGSASYRRGGGLLFAVNGPSLGSGSPATQGFTIDINTGNLLSMWNRPDTGLSHPHDVTVDTRDHVVYVGELNPSKIWTFRMDSALYAANKTVTNSGSQLPSVVVNAGSSTGVSGQYGSSDHSSGTLVQSNSGQQVDTASTGTSDPVLPGSGSSVISEKVKASDSSEGLQSNMGSVLVKTAEITNTEEDMGPSLIIGALLVVPVVLLIVITVLVRLYHTGQLDRCCRRRGRKPIFNLGNFLNSHKGFDPLSTEDDDHDIDNALDDSDNEEFSITRKA